MGMLVIRMLWLTPILKGPNSSDVMETAAAKMKPELRPIKAVPISRASALPDAVRRKKAMGVGVKASASHPVLAK